MQRIIVKNFGPLKDLDLEIKDFMVFIGPNASGKSTLAKLIYFFLKVPENISKAYLESFGLTNEELKTAICVSYWSFLSYDFSSIFGSDSYIKFEYDSEKYIEFNPSPPPHHTVTFSVDYSGKIDGILDYLNQLKSFFETKIKDTNTHTVDFTTLKYSFGDEVKSVLNLEFNNQILLKKYYFPDGRGNINFDSQYLPVYQKSFLDIAAEAQFFLRDILERGIKKEELVDIIGGKIKKIDSNRFGLQIDDKHDVVYQLLSSGQKEVYWFLVCLFQIYKKDEPNRLFIEEPESHLFPDKQKNLIKFLTQLFNKSHSELLITTHSHYIIGAVNVLVNAHRIGQNHPDEVEKIISKDLWLDKERIFVGRLKDGKLESVYSSEGEIFEHEELTQTSGILNEEYSQLLDIEFESTNEKK
jgi:AAA15 family ATPase/GTPase